MGLDEYEVRSWIGWHHHMTLTMLSLWFLVLEHRRVKNAPALTVAQVRRIFALALTVEHNEAEIAELVTRQLLRNDEARRNHRARLRKRPPPLLKARSPLKN